MVPCPIDYGQANKKYCYVIPDYNNHLYSDLFYFCGTG